MAIQKFEDIIAWKKAQDLAVEVYALFSKSKDYGFRDQICRASVSISNNIAEGFDRSSHADFKRFLYIALASCSEVKSMLYLAERLDYVNSEKATVLKDKCTETSKIITGFIKALN
ncbi:four helix bundle protein [Reichenbachiella sp. MALMAid0571]|uniref:four helix bundle protein n=1 Tax=Reichenbachiella sp. MALMAid0571 TaxID=3143939 RepID=UPI0032DF7601